MSRIQPFGYGQHLIEDDDIEAVVNVLRDALITQGPVVEAFETALAEKVGAKHAVAVTSGTAGLHLACLAAGLQPGDLGLTSTMTFVASANCLKYCASDVGLIDIDPETLCMDKGGLSDALKSHPQTRVVIPVHFAGCAADMAEIREIADGRLVIEDAAHSLGSFYDNGRPVGCGDYADMTVFSFHPVKPITTGEGGAILTNDDGLAKKLRNLRTHGIERNPEFFQAPEAGLEGNDPCRWYFEQQALGFNYRLTDIQAALGLSQLKKLDRFIERRREIAKAYDAAMSALPSIRPYQSADRLRNRSGHHLYLANIDFDEIGLTRPQFMAALGEHGIGTQVHYIPVYRHPYYFSAFPDRDLFPITEDYYAHCLSLPIFPAMTDEHVDYVIEKITAIVTA